jgi:hypothetical protein
VVPDRERVIAHQVHRLRDRLALVRVRDEGPLPCVSGVHEQRPPGGARAEHRDLAGKLRHAAGAERRACVRALHDVGVEVTVNVVGVQQLDPVVSERARRWRWRDR